jgi:adenylosuccinate lyase
LTRGNAEINRETLHAFISGLKVSKEVKKELKAVTPFNYVGVLPE